MSDPIEVKVNSNDMSVEEPDQTIIHSIELLNALVVEPAEAWQLIATSFGLAVSTDDVSITEDGRIHIRNKDLTAKAKQILAGIGGASGNGVCGNISCAEMEPA